MAFIRSLRHCVDPGAIFRIEREAEHAAAKFAVRPIPVIR
jgi:hypothetical protein